MKRVYSWAEGGASQHILGWSGVHQSEPEGEHSFFKVKFPETGEWKDLLLDWGPAPKLWWKLDSGQVQAEERKTGLPPGVQP